MSARGVLLSAVFMVGLLFIYASLSSSTPSSSLVPFSVVITSPQTNLTFPARPAAFGPSLPIPSSDGSDEGSDQDSQPVFTGEIFVVSGDRGCATEDYDDGELMTQHRDAKLSTNGSSESDDNTSGNDKEDMKNKIAVVLRGKCSFYQKVLNLQQSGAAAVIVGDVGATRGLLTMSAKGNTHEVSIPSFFVSHSSYLEIMKLKSIVIIPSQPSSPVLDTLLFLLVSPLLSLTLIYALLIFHRRYKRMRDRAPKAFVENLPTRIWGGEQEQTGREKEWGSSAECVICLEDYITGVSQVMKLPCGHEFHSNCITPWLTLRKRTCPICKRDVTSTNEELPLLASSSATESSDPDLEESRLHHFHHNINLQHMLAEEGSSSSIGEEPAVLNIEHDNLIELDDGDHLYDSSNATNPAENASSSNCTLDAELDAQEESSDASQELSIFPSQLQPSADIGTGSSNV
ncbi:hypothetical protein V1511DRAFT_486889 [Dipodascopsis uninucleata]